MDSSPRDLPAYARLVADYNTFIACWNRDKSSTTYGILRKLNRKYLAGSAVVSLVEAGFFGVSLVLLYTLGDEIERTNNYLLPTPYDHLLLISGCFALSEIVRACLKVLSRKLSEFIDLGSTRYLSSLMLELSGTIPAFSGFENTVTTLGFDAHQVSTSLSLFYSSLGAAAALALLDLLSVIILNTWAIRFLIILLCTSILLIFFVFECQKYRGAALGRGEQRRGRFLGLIASSLDTVGAHLEKLVLEGHNTARRYEMKSITRMNLFAGLTRVLGASFVPWVLSGAFATFADISDNTLPMYGGDTKFQGGVTCKEVLLCLYGVFQAKEYLSILTNGVFLSIQRENGVRRFDKFINTFAELIRIPNPLIPLSSSRPWMLPVPHPSISQLPIFRNEAKKGENENAIESSKSRNVQITNGRKDKEEEEEEEGSDISLSGNGMLFDTVSTIFGENSWNSSQVSGKEEKEEKSFGRLKKENVLLKINGAFEHPNDVLHLSLSRVTNRKYVPPVLVDSLGLMKFKVYELRPDSPVKYHILECTDKQTEYSLIKLFAGELSLKKGGEVLNPEGVCMSVIPFSEVVEPYNIIPFRPSIVVMEGMCCCKKGPRGRCLEKDMSNRIKACQQLIEHAMKCSTIRAVVFLGTKDLIIPDLVYKQEAETEILTYREDVAYYKVSRDGVLFNSLKAIKKGEDVHISSLPLVVYQDSLTCVYKHVADPQSEESVLQEHMYETSERKMKPLSSLIIVCSSLFPLISTALEVALFLYYTEIVNTVSFTETRKYINDIDIIALAFIVANVLTTLILDKIIIRYNKHTIIQIGKNALEREGVFKGSSKTVSAKLLDAVSNSALEVDTDTPLLNVFAGTLTKILAIFCLIIGLAAKPIQNIDALAPGVGKCECVIVSTMLILIFVSGISCAASKKKANADFTEFGRVNENAVWLNSRIGLERMMGLGTKDDKKVVHSNLDGLLGASYALNNRESLLRSKTYETTAITRSVFSAISSIFASTTAVVAVSSNIFTAKVSTGSKRTGSLLGCFSIIIPLVLHLGQLADSVVYLTPRVQRVLSASKRINVFSMKQRESSNQELDSSIELDRDGEDDPVNYNLIRRNTGICIRARDVIIRDSKTKDPVIHISFSLEAGKAMIITVTDKSPERLSLLSLLFLGVISPSSGTITTDGHDLSLSPKRDICVIRLNPILQQTNLDDIMTVDGMRDKRRISNILAACGLPSDLLPHVIGGSTSSSVLKQLVLLARCVLLGARCIVLETTEPYVVMSALHVQSKCHFTLLILDVGKCDLSRVKNVDICKVRIGDSVLE